MSDNIEPSLLKDYFDNSESIIVIIDNNKKIVFLNSFGCELIGYKIKEVIGKNWFETFVPKRKREELIKVFEKIIQGESQVIKTYSYPILLRGGLERIILWKNSIITDQNNEINAILSIGDDITDREQLIQDLKIERELKSKIVDTSPIGITVYNKKGNIIFANKKAEDILGLKMEEIVNMTYNSPEWRPTDYEGNTVPDENLPFSIVKRTKKTVYNIKYSIELPNKEKVFLNVNGAPLFDKNKNFNGMVASIEDFTEKIKVKRELNRLNRAYKMLSECNSQLIQFNNESALFQKICDIIIEIGGYCLAWIGLKKEDISKSVVPIAKAGFEDGYLEAINISWAETDKGKGPTGKAIRTAKPIICRNILEDPSFEPWREDAIKRGYKSSIALPLIIDNEAIGALNIYSKLENAFYAEESKLLEKLAENLAFGVQKIRSEKRRKQAEKKLKKSKIKYKKAYNRVEFYKDLFAHDINNILQSILTGLELIKINIKDLEKEINILEDLNTIEIQIERGSRLVLNIHKFSLLEKEKFELEKINAYNILNTIIKRIKKSPHIKPLEIEIETISNQIYIQANEFLEDVFENLLINAIKHNDSKIIEILIRISKEERNNKSFIKFEFIDNGIGILDEKKEMIFLRAAEENRTYYGRGLGLSLTKKIIESYNGFIWVENRVKDDFSKGSKFILLIPEVS